MRHMRRIKYKNHYFDVGNNARIDHYLNPDIEKVGGTDRTRCYKEGGKSIPCVLKLYKKLPLKCEVKKYSESKCVDALYPKNTSISNKLYEPNKVRLHDVYAALGYH